MRFTTIICSYLFFALLTFNAFALLSSEFFPLFSQVFMLLTQDGRIYNVFSLILLGLAIFMVLINPIKIYRSKNIFGKTAPFVVSLFGIITLSILIILFYWIFNKFNQDLPLFSKTDQSIIMLTHENYYLSIEFFITLLCWIFFVFIPLLYRILSLNFNIDNRLAKSLFILEPSLTTIIITMSATAFHPYFSDLPSRPFNFLLFYTSCGLLIYLLLKRENKLGFYEYANMIFLSFIILCYILCSESILRGIFFNAQITLYMLALLSWCSEWMQNKDELQNKII
ncbi:hypothetical protein CQA53_01700 [Helicobacter didelphidarum]|uniref:Uncharacterized protein n=1 Tax=Helicobacter didelphidarum TaxID=2040648 RepID=A0A3D8IQW1_9HELI|nr:hypothetical protein [Helicobacter didelphidarum]RDU67004.1 hypothetical protein CQA53_01700 [Helicobacter didelphidarum]